MRRSTAAFAGVTPRLSFGPRFLESPGANGRTLPGASAASSSRTRTCRTSGAPKPPAADCSVRTRAPRRCRNQEHPHDGVPSQRAARFWANTDGAVKRCRQVKLLRRCKFLESNSFCAISQNREVMPRVAAPADCTVHCKNSQRKIRKSYALAIFRRPLAGPIRRIARLDAARSLASSTINLASRKFVKSHLQSTAISSMTVEDIRYVEWPVYER